MVTPAHVEFEPGVGEIVFRTLRELLTNVRKHSRASLVQVTSRYRHDGAVAITVADNGIGLQSVTRRKHPFEGGGFGLWSIEHRLGELGGTLELESDSGLRATVVVPRKFLLKS
jgi:signal transduction histidine kinase